MEIASQNTPKRRVESDMEYLDSDNNPELTPKRRRRDSDIIMDSPESKPSPPDRSPSPPENETEAFLSKYTEDGLNVYGMKGFEFYGQGPIGDGAFGTVKLIVEKSSMTHYACKVIGPSHVSKYYSDIKRESKIQLKLDHPRIVKLHKTIQSPMGVYMVMEYVSGGELFDKIEPDVGLSEEKSMRYFGQVLEGVVSEEMEQVLIIDCVAGVPAFGRYCASRYQA